MGLQLPQIGGSQDSWGTILGVVFQLLENHSHESGKGVPIPSSALGINGDTNWASYALTAAKAITFTEVATSAMTSYSDALYVDSATHNLTFKNNVGVPVVLTSGNTINMSLIGGWSGDFSSVAASADYVDSIHTFGLHQQIGGGVRQYGKLATSDVSLFEFKANPATGVPVNAVTLKSPASLAAPYSVTWLAALPGATSALQLSSAGVMTASNTFATLITAPDYKWSSTRDVPVPLQPVAALVVNTAYDGDHISLDSSGTNWDARTMVLSALRSGDRIVGATTTSSFTGTMQLRIDKINGGSASSTGCTIAVVSGFSQTGTFSSAYTLQAGDAVYIDISGSATGAVLKQLTLQVDRP